MHVNWKEKSGKGIIAGRVAGTARLGLGIGCLTVCCMMCLLVTSASAAGTGKTKVNLDFTKIKKALGKSTTASSYPVASKPRQMSSSTQSTNASTTASTTASTAGSLSNTMAGMAGIAGSMAGTMADAMAGSMAGSMAGTIVGSMAPAMTGGTPGSTPGMPPHGMPPHNMGSVQMNSSIAKVIEETRNQMMKDTMQGMFGNQSMMADMQKKVMSESMPNNSLQGSIQSSARGNVLGSGQKLGGK